MDDEAIVAPYWNRDEAAITETDRKYGPYCRSIAQNILSNREDAEECVSDTWRHAWNAMPPQGNQTIFHCAPAFFMIQYFI